jgi:hypothetical protein
MKRIPVIAAFVLLFSALIAGPVVAWRYRAQQQEPVHSESNSQQEQEGFPVIVTIKQGDRSWTGEVRRAE